MLVFQSRLLLFSCVIWGKRPGLSVPLCPHKEFEGGWEELFYVKHLEQ